MVNFIQRSDVLFSIHKKTNGLSFLFQLLFNTLYASFWDVLAYLACICVLFVGYMSFGYVVLGPYHVKVNILPDKKKKRTSKNFPLSSSFNAKMLIVIKYLF